MQRARMERIRQSGAIAVRAGKTPEVLLIRARRDPRQWIFPKGHIEPGEAAAKTALRELWEEAGVEGSIAREVGALTFDLGEGKAEVRYFLICAERQGKGQEGRELLWCEREEALSLMSFPDARQLLIDVWPDIEALVGARPPGILWSGEVKTNDVA